MCCVYVEIECIDLVLIVFDVCDLVVGQVVLGDVVVVVLYKIYIYNKLDLFGVLLVLDDLDCVFVLVVIGVGLDDLYVCLCLIVLVGVGEQVDGEFFVCMCYVDVIE